MMYWTDVQAATPLSSSHSLRTRSLHGAGYMKQGSAPNLTAVLLSITR